MQQNEFEILLQQLCQKETLVEALSFLGECSEEEIAFAAQSLKGQFGLAEVAGERRIYHITMQENESGEETEFVEHVMNEGEHLIKFAAWFFETFFEIKPKETYKSAGKTYQQPKR
ncbi:hypothetical protein [Vibrio sagamiensis]|uniref:Uncharacterized protein n=1 Tax=Vibrio sagamiensis NBRC 104589 TaxID=1219064 RepID=A0A511QGX6_9VIBR|nr:hypothetical protein [Vibrio sagamiensis]PNQ54070.1 hypothetical protein C1141_17815 [Vibrio agarivorans]GEM76570.1 hypothetical protein VSA01S_26820 [Vibrio sagamiensis NBRC 104589]